MTGAGPLLVIGSLPCEFLWYNFLASFPELHTIQLLLLVCKNGEGRPGEILWHECLPWHTVGKHTLWKNAIYTCILHPKQQVVHFPLWQTFRDMHTWTVKIIWTPSPLVSTSADIYHVIKPSPVFLHILKTIKNWTVKTLIPTACIETLLETWKTFMLFLCTKKHKMPCWLIWNAMILFVDVIWKVT